jgi:ankyrin repeat protein
VYRRTIALAACWLITIGCDRLAGPLPQPPTPVSRMVTDAGFPIKPRPPCSEIVVAALNDPDLGAIARAASRGVQFTCGEPEYALPLDRAVLSGSLERVRALLEAGADPNARWASYGDRFPLQEVIEARRYGVQQMDRVAMARLLLQHGADPNARWCPDGSRLMSPAGPPCVSDTAAPPLFVAAALDQTDMTYLLLDDGADATLSTWTGQAALHQAWSEPVFELLAWALYPDRDSHDADTLRYLRTTPPAGHLRWGQPDWTPLARAILNGSAGYVPFVPPPSFKDLAEFRLVRAGLVRAILGIGADPNERVSGGVNWTPLKLAVDVWDPDIAEMLLARGADPDARWCTTAVSDRRGTGVIYQRVQGCELSTGTTALMLAASFGRAEVVSTLMKHGADRALRDWQNRTAADYARSAGHHDVAATLERR